MDMKKYGGFIPLIVAMLLIFSYSVPAIRDGVGSFLDTYWARLRIWSRSMS